MDRHDHAEAGTTGRAFAWAVALNMGFVLTETGFGFAAGSLALIADAAHNLTDVAGLLIAWSAALLARRMPRHATHMALGALRSWPRW